MNESYFKNLAIEYFLNSSIGEKLKEALEDIGKLQEYLSLLQEKKDEDGIVLIKIGTTLTLAILNKMFSGKSIKSFSKDDWKEIAFSVGEYSLELEEQKYTEFVFILYTRYIDNSAEDIKDYVTEETYCSIKKLSAELAEKTRSLEEGTIREVDYIEDCLWVCLEAMIKLVSVYPTTAIPFKESEDRALAERLAVSIPSLAFEYGRYTLYAKEQAILEQYLQNQYLLDEKIELELKEYNTELEEKSQQFYILLEQAFSPNFRESFLGSIKLAKEAGVSEEEILVTEEDIDDFFLN